MFRQTLSQKSSKLIAKGGGRIAPRKQYKIINYQQKELKIFDDTLKEDTILHKMIHSVA